MNLLEIKKRVHEVLEKRKRETVICKNFDRLMALLILINVLAVIFETIIFSQPFKTFFYYLESISIFIFTLELALRIWSSTDHYSGAYVHPITGRLKYMLTPLALLDLLAILPFYFATYFAIDTRFMRVFRLLRFLKIMRYFKALETLGIVIMRERNTLMAIIVLMFSILTFASSLVYFLEINHPQKVFSSIPHAMWWGIATLTTVGYGDIVPASPLGKILGVIIMLTGIAMFALPAGILASGFSEESKRKNFMITWNLVASVPFFKRVNASEIAKIADTLYPFTAMPNEVIFHRDQPGDSMYFIVSGEVEIEIPGNPMRLSRGEYFGEIALLYDCQRIATVVAITYVELLRLDANDFNRILENNPSLKLHMEKEAKRRLSTQHPVETYT